MRAYTHTTLTFNARIRTRSSVAAAKARFREVRRVRPASSFFEVEESRLARKLHRLARKLQVDTLSSHH